MRTTIALLCLLLPAAAFAWDGAPRTIAGVTTAPALVAASHDGADGAFVAWQEAASAPAHANTLRVTRLTPAGDAHAAWPANGLEIGGGAAVRSALGLVSDDAGGAYAWWTQGGTLRLTRVLGDGSIAAGWTAAGRVLGALTNSQHRPWVQSDGAGGVWLGWFQGARTTVLSPAVRIAHLGPGGAGAGGWPSSPRAVPLSGADDEWVYSASFAPAADGGAWALVATGRVAEPDFLPGEWRLVRFTPAGGLDPTYPPEGVVVEPFEADQLGPVVPRIGIGAVTDDGAGGTFLALGRVTDATTDFYPTWSAYGELRRRAADGSPHEQQPAPAQIGWWSESVGDGCANVGCAYPAFSLALLRDAAGNRVVAAPNFEVHAGLVLTLRALDALGNPGATIAGASGAGVALHPAYGSGFVISTFDPTGPTSQYDSGHAYVGFHQTATTGWYLQETFSPYSPVYTASDVAALPDGGAVLVWARALDPAGLYAIRVGANGSPLTVEPGPGGPGRGLRLVREGAGLRADWDAGAEGSLALLDVAGRVRARLAVGAGAGSARLEPGQPLEPGVYFARLMRADGARAVARAVLLR